MSEWKLTKDFPIKALKTRYPFKKNSYHSDHRQYAQLYFERYKTVIIDHIDSKYLDTFPMIYEKGDLGERFTISLNLVQHKMIFSQKKVRRKGARKGTGWKFQVDDPIYQSKTVYFYTFDLTIGDLLKIYYHKSEKVCDEKDLSASQIEKRKLLEKRKQIIDRGFKIETENQDLNFLGFLKNNNLFKIHGQEYKTSDLNNFLHSKIILYDLDDMKHRIRVSDPKLKEYLSDTVLKLVNESLVDSLVGYFYFGRDLYAHDDTIHFEEPVTMKKFIDLIDDDCKNKSFLKQKIFKTCNGRESEVLGKFSPRLIESFESIPDNMPAYAFRTLMMKKFSNGMVNELVQAVWSAVDRSIIPKRYKNQRERCFEQDWRRNRYSEKNYYGYNETIKAEQDFIRETIREGQITERIEGDIYTMEQNDDLQYAYLLPTRIQPEDGNLEAELCKFMTDGEILEKCMEVDENGLMTLNEKLNELNMMGYSRVDNVDHEGQKVTTYLLIPPGYDVRFKSEFITYQDFYVPSSDKKLPKIVLVTCYTGDTDKDEVDEVKD